MSAFKPDDNVKRYRMSGPDFFGIGQQKAGTGWLYYQLLSHPDFWLPPVKELHFFDRDFNFHKVQRRFNSLLRRRDSADKPWLWRHQQWRDLIEQGSGLDKLSLDKLESDFEFYRRALLSETARKLERKKRERVDQVDFARKINNRQLQFYLDLFDVTDRLSGDITPAYGILPQDSIRVITKKFPDAKYILQIRHPVSRTVSHIQHYYRNGAIDEQDFANADSVANLLKAMPQFVSNSLISKIYANWNAEIDPKQLLVLSLDEIASTPHVARKRLAEFMGVDVNRFILAPESNHKERHQKVEIPRESIDYLKEFFSSEVAYCRKNFGQLCAHWD